MPPNVTKKTLTATALSGVFLVGAALAGCHRDESTATLLAEAQQYQQKGDQKAALIQLKNAVAKTPEDGQARLALGALYLDAGDTVSADKELRKAASLGITPDRILPLLGKAMLAQGRFQQVLDELTPEHARAAPQLLSLRGDALLALNQLDAAKQAYQTALDAKLDASEPRLGLARLAVLQKDLPTAHRYIDEALARDPKNAEIPMFNGTLLRAEGKPDEALAAFDQALALKPGLHSAYIEKAYIEIGARKFAAAKADLDAARKKSPGNLLVTYTQGLLDFTEGNPAAARESLQKVLRASPEHMPTILLAGAVELNLGAPQQAERHLRKYLEANPGNLYARKMLAQALLKSAQPGDALAALAPALKDAPQDPQLLALAGETYLQVKDFDKAASYLERASALAPKAAVLHTSLGLSRLGQGDRDKGVSELEIAATLDPKSTSAAFPLIQAELGLQHYDKALAAVQALEKQQPDNVQVQNLKGAVYFARGDRAAARGAFDKALALAPTSYPTVANLARLDLQDQQPQAARKRFETLLEKDKKNAEAMAALAELALAQGKPDDATRWLEKASNDNPDAIAPALRLGNHYLATRQQKQALTLARKFQTANPTNADLLDLLGQAQLANDDAAGALETYSKLVNVLPKSAQAQMRLATAHRMMKNDAAMAADLKRAVELQPDFLPARLAQAQLAMAGGKPEAALAIARQLQQLNGNAAAAGQLLEGDVQMSRKQPALALAAYQKAYQAAKAPQLLIKLVEAAQLAGKANLTEPLLAQWQREHPDDTVVPLYVAAGQLGARQFKPAIASLEQVLKRAPNNPEALNNLAWAYQQDKDPRALATAEQALKAMPNSPAVMDTLGWLLVEQGNHARGVPLLQKAAALAPAAPDVHYHLAVGLVKSGDKANARKELDTLLSQNKPFGQIDEARALLKTL